MEVCTRNWIITGAGRLLDAINPKVNGQCFTVSSELIIESLELESKLIRITWPLTIPIISPNYQDLDAMLLNSQLAP